MHFTRQFFAVSQEAALWLLVCDSNLIVAPVKCCGFTISVVFTMVMEMSGVVRLEEGWLHCQYKYVSRGITTCK